MQLSIYLNPILKHFTDSRIVRNINQMVRKIIENQSIRLWSNASDKAEFDRCKRLIDGSLKSVLLKFRTDAWKSRPAKAFDGANGVEEVENVVFIGLPAIA